MKKNIYILLLLFILISIAHMGSMFWHPVREYFNKRQNIVLLGDSILNNSGYVGSEYTVGSLIRKNIPKQLF